MKRKLISLVVTILMLVSCISPLSAYAIELGSLSQAADFQLEKMEEDFSDADYSGLETSVTSGTGTFSISGEGKAARLLLNATTSGTRFNVYRNIPDLQAGTVVVSTKVKRGISSSTECAGRMDMFAFGYNETYTGTVNFQGDHLTNTTGGANVDGDGGYYLGQTADGGFFWMQAVLTRPNANSDWSVAVYDIGANPTTRSGAPRRMYAGIISKDVMPVVDKVRLLTTYTTSATFNGFLDDISVQVYKKADYNYEEDFNDLYTLDADGAEVALENGTITAKDLAAQTGFSVKKEGITVEDGAITVSGVAYQAARVHLLGMQRGTTTVSFKLGADATSMNVLHLDGMSDPLFTVDADGNFDADLQPLAIDGFYSLRVVFDRLYATDDWNVTIYDDNSWGSVIKETTISAAQIESISLAKWPTVAGGDATIDDVNVTYTDVLARLAALPTAAPTEEPVATFEAYTKSVSFADKADAESYSAADLLAASGLEATSGSATYSITNGYLDVKGASGKDFDLYFPMPTDVEAGTINMSATISIAGVGSTANYFGYKASTEGASRTWYLEGAADAPRSYVANISSTAQGRTGATYDATIKADNNTKYTRNTDFLWQFASGIKRYNNDGSVNDSDSRIATIKMSLSRASVDEDWSLVLKDSNDRAVYTRTIPKDELANVSRVLLYRQWTTKEVHVFIKDLSIDVQPPVVEDEDEVEAYTKSVSFADKEDATSYAAADLLAASGLEATSGSATYSITNGYLDVKGASGKDFCLYFPMSTDVEAGTINMSATISIAGVGSSATYFGYQASTEGASRTWYLAGAEDAPRSYVASVSSTAQSMTGATYDSSIKTSNQTDYGHNVDFNWNFASGIKRYNNDGTVNDSDSRIATIKMSLSRATVDEDWTLVIKDFKDRAVYTRIIPKDELANVNKILLYRQWTMKEVHVFIKDLAIDVQPPVVEEETPVAREEIIPEIFTNDITFGDVAFTDEYEETVTGIDETISELTATVTATNAQGTDARFSMILAVYDADGRLKDYSISANNTATSAGTSCSVTTTAGYVAADGDIAKVLFVDFMSILRPLGELGSLSARQ